MFVNTTNASAKKKCKLLVFRAPLRFFMWKFRRLKFKSYILIKYRTEVLYSDGTCVSDGTHKIDILCICGRKSHEKDFTKDFFAISVGARGNSVALPLRLYFCGLCDFQSGNMRRFWKIFMERKISHSSSEISTNIFNHFPF